MDERRTSRADWLTGLIALGFAGCAAEVGTEEDFGEDIDVVVEPILNGLGTTGWHAVGKVTIGGGGNIDADACSGTLISSRVVLSAAHCFDYSRSLSNLGTQFNPPISASSAVNARFTLTNTAPPAGQQAEQTFVVTRVYTLGQALGESDLAILELDRDVDPRFATPMQVATSAPPQGATVTGVGYGCITPNGSVDGRKRQRPGSWQAATWNTIPALGCKGDSGGPLVYNSRVVAVFSGPGPNNTDLNARAVTHRATIDRINAIYGTRQLCTTCPIIALKTSDNQHYLQAPNAGGAGATINANPTAVGSWERFRLVQFAHRAPAPMPSWVALQAESGRWVGAMPDSSGQVKTNRDHIFDNEMFFVENRGLGKWSLKTNSVTRYFITAEGGGGGTVSSNRTAFGPWETFAFPFP
jgi:hypothetical protein